jgi:hypothetical protein
MNGLIHCSKIASLINCLVSAEQHYRHLRADRRRGLEIYYDSELIEAFAFAEQLRLVDRAA